jgi:hypothetical protein
MSKRHDTPELLATIRGKRTRLWVHGFEVEAPTMADLERLQEKLCGHPVDDSEMTEAEARALLRERLGR